MSVDSTYAEIPKKAQWNFPSSSEDDDDTGQRRRKKANLTTKPKLQTQESTTSDEDEDKPILPPKMWEAATTTETLNVDATEPFEDGSHSASSNINEATALTTEEEDITIEYSALHRTDNNRKGSLVGQDDNERQGEDDHMAFTHLLGFEENEENIDTISIQSASSSSKVVTDFEQSSTCVDMDQLSLDSSGKRPKRIVETHETHEIVPADNHEDDIVERIIETQTITEKLDDNTHAFKDYTGEDYSRYLEDDDEFVSHIFTLGRTLEKGAKKKKPKDFAFVENPFSVAEPVIETMPLEKKTVKQKITTLVKKKKAEENVYAEVELSNKEEGASMLTEENDLYDHTSDAHRQIISAWESPSATAQSSRGQRASRQSTDSDGMIYESLEDMPTSYGHSPILDKKKATKSEKKSLFKGIKRFLKKKDKNQETEQPEPSVLDEDYQEFVP